MMLGQSCQIMIFFGYPFFWGQEYIKVYIKSIAKDYVVDKTNMEYRYGINNQMIEKNNYLTFSRIINNVKDNWMLEKIVTN